MKKMSYLRKHKEIGIFLILIGILLSTIPNGGGLLSSLQGSNEIILFKEMQSGKYEGTLKVYLVEPQSRWLDYDDQTYHFGFLEYVLNESVSIYFNQTYSTQKTLLIDELEFSDINTENIMLIAAVFNENPHLKYAYPPSQNPFQGFYVDASAACYPNEIGYNVRNEEYTHTIFIEEGTAQWCHNCPPVSDALYEIYNSSDYPFYFISLVSDKNINAKERLTQDYNILGYPTSFFDGGNEVIVGNKENIEAIYRSTIEQCSQRDVHDLNLSISSTWNNDEEFSIAISIKNEELKSPDTTNPTLIIEQPENGFYFNNNRLFDFPTVFAFGNINFLINATDNNSGIKDVSIFVNNELKETLNQGENSWSLNEKLFGRYEITIIATDNVGNQDYEQIILWKFF